MHAIGLWARRSMLPVLAVWVPVVALWSGLLWRLRQEWAWSETYRFGYWVPLLVVLLVVRRWKNQSDVQNPSSVSRQVRAGIAIGLAVLPCELLIRANPDWRVAFWFYGAVAFTGSIYWLSVLAGRRWASQFMPALALLFLAIPWLTVIEQPIIQGLSRFVAASAAEVANLCGIPAAYEGNTIALENDVHLGVEDACSGLRSFQAALMAAWFFGELVLLGWVRRLALLIIGCALAAGLNGTRAFLLVIAAAGEAEKASLDAYHDRLGTGTALTLFMFLAFATWLLARKSAHFAHNRNQSTNTVNPTVNWASVALTSACVVSMIFATWWFRQSSEPAPVRALVAWDQLHPSVEFREIAPQAQKMLRFSEAQHVIWEPKKGVRCDIFFHNWEAGQISSFADVHRPEICLPASGIDLTPRGQWSPSPASIAFDTWSAEHDMNVFFSSWDCRANALGDRQAEGQNSGRIAKALHGESISARQSMEIVVLGAEDMLAARSIVENFVQSAVTIGP